MAETVSSELEAAVAAAGWVRSLFDRDDMAVWVTDHERFLHVAQYGSFSVDFKTGDLLRPGGTPAKIIATGQRVSRLVPAEVYGVACKTIGFPVGSGAMGVSFSIAYEEALQRDLGSLQDSARRFTASSGSLAGSAKALGSFMGRVSEDLEQAHQQLRAIDRVGLLIASIAEDARYISLNALIEAHRVEEGNSFIVVAKEMKALSSKIQAALLEVGTNLESMQGRFQALQQAVGSARRHVDEQSDASQAISRELQQVSEAIHGIEQLALGL